MCNAMNRLEAKLKVSSEPQTGQRLCGLWLSCALSSCFQRHEGTVYPASISRHCAILTTSLHFFACARWARKRKTSKEVLLPNAGVQCDALIAAYELSAETLTKAISGSVVKSALQKGLNQMLVSGNISALEKARDNYLLSLVNAHRHEVMTIFPMVGYFLARDREAKAIRLILTVKRNGLDDAVIAERLRELYG